MRDIPGFKIDKWAQEYTPKAEIKLHGSYATALTLNELQKLSSDSSRSPVDFDFQLAYGTATGLPALRKRVAEIHSSENVKLTEDNVVITPGSIMANYLVLTTICGKGDHLICQYPTYGQLYILPRFQGVDVDLWKMKAENDWIPKVEDLAAMIKPNTKAIVVNNPSNPTGTVLPDNVLKEILALAEKHNILVFADEVFSPLFHTSDPPPPPLVSLGYKKSVSTGSVSKSYGLPGIRVGWVVSQDPAILEQVITAMDYTTNFMSQLDEGVAAFALGPDVLPQLLERNLAGCRSRIATLDEFVKRNAGRCSWVAPKGAGTAFIRILNRDGTPVDDLKFCNQLVDKYGVSVIPGGQCFSDEGLDDFKGYIRLTLGDKPRFEEGLALIEKLLSEPEDF